MSLLTECLTALLDLVAPVHCAWCGARGGQGGELRAPAPGLRPWDADHACASCLASLAVAPVRGAIDGLPLWSPLREDAELVRVIGLWKYQGVRGLARPLARLVAPALRCAAAGTPRAVLAPAPLHRRRRRERGFDQCRQLAVLAGEGAGVPVADVLMRRRATAQQASLAANDAGRRANVAGAFEARSPRGDESGDLIILDDLATTGATLAAAAGAATVAGWRVAALVCVGQAGRLAEAPRG
jgi:predicted amidophosphoribosyltransferase